jgi:hypothetical protein
MWIDIANLLKLKELEHFPIMLAMLMSLPGSAGQCSTHGRHSLDRPVEPGDPVTLSISS